MSKKNMVEGIKNGPRDERSLDSRYGEIGISAVAAALQFKSKPELAHAPINPQLDKLLADKAA
jgi:hypothetical protein